MWYMMEVIDANHFRRAKELTAKTATKAKEEASKKQAFQGTMLFIGQKIDAAGYLSDGREYVKRDGVWSKC